MTDHAYTILSAHVVETANGTVQLLKLRNPWGFEMYNGPWSDKDPVWTEDLLKKMGHTLKNDGTFFIAVDDFRKIFVWFTVLRYDENWKRT